MKSHTTILIIVVVILLVWTGCRDKDENSGGWVSCSDCTFESWTGEFTGTATYFDAVSLDKVTGLEITVEFEETATEYLTAYINVPQYYSTAVSGEWKSPYSVSFAGTGSSLDVTLYKRNGELKLAGNSKKFHFKVDSLMIDEVINFEAYKQTN